MARLENRELAKLEPALPVSGDTRSLSAALITAKIRSAPLEEIKQVLRYAMVKIGLRAQNWPSDLEKQVLVEHIWKEYGGHGVDEIKLAFDMAIAGKLNVEANCYENFSCLYFSTIMAAYRAWAKEEYKQIDKPSPDALPAPKEDLSDKAMQEWLIDSRKKVCAGGYSFQFLPMMLYRWLAKNGKMNLTAGKKAQYLQKAVEYRRGLYLESLEKCEDSAVRGRLRAFCTMMETGEVTGDEIDTVEGITRRMILFDYLLDLED